LDAISGYTMNWSGEVSNSASNTEDVIVPFEKIDGP